MTVMQSAKLMDLYAACPKCGCEVVGNGKGTMECDTKAGYFKRTCACGWSVELQEKDSHMTQIEWMRTLPPETFSVLLRCPNDVLKDGYKIACTRGTPEHINCNACIAKFLETEVAAEHAET